MEHDNLGINQRLHRIRRVEERWIGSLGCALGGTLRSHLAERLLWKQSCRHRHAWILGHLHPAWGLHVAGESAVVACVGQPARYLLRFRLFRFWETPARAPAAPDVVEGFERVVN
jgi:hypothetical protein